LDLLTVGEAFEDLVFAGLPRLPRLGEELRGRALASHPGGGAIITAIAARRLGLSTGALTAVSAANARALRHERVALVNLKRHDEQGAVTVALSTSRDRAFVTYDGVNRRLEGRLLAALPRTAPRARHVHFALAPRRCDRWIPAIERLRRRGVSSSWDFGWHEELPGNRSFPRLLKAVDWVFVNEDEALLYTGTRAIGTARRAWHQAARGAVLKLGARGALLIAGGQEHHVPSGRARVVDTTGAGDSFNAGFLAGVLAGASLTDAARLGNHVGARSVGAIGGIDGLPRRDRLPRWAHRVLSAP
jgi:sugar/nucleoside kinase (ribokinase family)